MIGDMYTPPMYRDLMSSGMINYEIDPTLYGMGTYAGGMMDPTMMGMGGFYNTNYLGGLKMQRVLNHDTINIVRKKEQESVNFMKNIGLAALGVLGFAAVTTFFKGKVKPKSPSMFSKMTSSIKNCFSNLGSKFRKKP